VIALVSARVWVEAGPGAEICGQVPVSRDTPVTGATVTATLVDKATKTPQTGCTDVALTDVDGTPGSYSATISEDFVSAPGDYILQVTAVKDDLNLYVEKAVTVVTRTV